MQFCNILLPPPSVCPQKIAHTKNDHGEPTLDLKLTTFGPTLSSIPPNQNLKNVTELQSEKQTGTKGVESISQKIKLLPFMFPNYKVPKSQVICKGIEILTEVENKIWRSIEYYQFLTICMTRSV